MMGCLAVIVVGVIAILIGKAIFSAFGWTGLAIFVLIIFGVISLMISGAEDYDEDDF